MERESRLGAVPAPALVLLGIVSVQFGAGLAKTLFDLLPPSAVVTLRLATSAVVLVIVSRRLLGRVLLRYGRKDLMVAVAFGFTLATMNFAIYESFSRIPLGIAVTIEFLGPLGVAVAFSRRRLDLVWVVLAALGVVVLMQDDGTGRVTPAGVAFALLAATMWAAYILLSAATGRRFAGTSGLAIASVVGVVVVAPAAVHEGGVALLDWRLVLIGLAVGVMSSVIPYTLELQALRRMPPRVFGILMSLQPAAAALAGMLLLAEFLSVWQWVAVGCVIAASVGATRTSRPADTG